MCRKVRYLMCFLAVDPCEDVACPGGNKCTVDPSSDTCYTCCKCDPKWEGLDC